MTILTLLIEIEAEQERFQKIIAAVLQDHLEAMAVGFFHRWNPETGQHEYAQHGNPTPYDINNGSCEEFCNDVIERMCPVIGRYETETLYAAAISTMNDYYYYFKSGPDVSHVVLVFHGRFYDAECLEGVDHWIDLPLCEKAFVKCVRKVKDRQARRRMEADGVS